MTDIGKEYGAALFALACEHDARDEYAQALGTVKELFEAQPEYLAFLASPSIPLGERLAAIDAAFGEALPEHVVSFLSLMCEKARIGQLFAAIEEYEALTDASRRVTAVTVTSAAELTAEQKQKLTAKLEKIHGGTVNASYVVDPSILGGVIVEAEGKITDGSLRHRLREVKEVINR